MRRSRAGGDARLHDRWSIGVGGHLNPGDGDVTGGLRREWAEELDAAFVPEFRPSACSTTTRRPWAPSTSGSSTSRTASGRPVAIRETEKLEGRFAAPSEVAAVRERMETWSRLVFDFLAGPTRDPGRLAWGG